MHHDNACPHSAAATQDLIATFGWEQFEYPPYSPDLVPRDFHAFLHLNNFLGGWRFYDNKVKEAINTWFASQVVLFYNSIRHCSKLVQVHSKDCGCTEGKQWSNTMLIKKCVQYL
jgi:hypothetical protein